MKIAIAGTGYVGLSNAVLLSQQNEEYAIGIAPIKVDKLNRKTSPIKNVEIEDYLAHKPLKLSATLDKSDAYARADFVIITTPTDYDAESNYFNVNGAPVESVIRDVMAINRHAVMVIKLTIPVGFTQSACEKYGRTNLIVTPNFLREGRALYDILYPSRIVVGERSERAKTFANLLKQGAIRVVQPPDEHCH